MKLSVIPKAIAHLLRQAITGKRGTVLQEGTPAPEFNVRDESGKAHALTDYRGKKVILWFYPRASTPG